MLVLMKFADETIWGGKKLDKYIDGNYSRIGHLYSIKCDATISNIILNGEFQGEQFNEYFDSNKDNYGLEEYQYFPLVIALTDAKDNLSIQVHPDDKIGKYDSTIKLGKGESWFFLESPGEGIYGGGKRELTKSALRNLTEDKVKELIGRVKAKKDDYFYIPPGTVHALTAGCFVYEIEENGGCTYRLYDYDRVDENGSKRDLHIDEALETIDLNSKPVLRKFEEGIPIEERRYSTTYYKEADSITNKSDTLQAVTIISGEVTISDIEYNTGTTIIIEPGDILNIQRAEVIVAEPKKINGNKIKLS